MTGNPHRVFVAHHPNEPDGLTACLRFIDPDKGIARLWMNATDARSLAHLLLQAADISDGIVLPHPTGADPQGNALHAFYLRHDPFYSRKEDQTA